MIQEKLSLSLALLLSLVPAICYALPSDKEKIIHVASDSANLSQKDRQGTYTGHVQFTQGSTHIQAAKAITQLSTQNQLSLAIANGSKGNQAHYWSATDQNKPPLHAYADSIRYYPLRHRIELIGNAHIQQGKNSFSAAKISYDTLAQAVISQSEGKTRTTIIIYPEKKSA